MHTHRTPPVSRAQAAMDLAMAQWARRNAAAVCCPPGPERDRWRALADASMRRYDRLQRQAFRGERIRHARAMRRLTGQRVAL